MTIENNKGGVHKHPALLCYGVPKEPADSATPNKQL
jgi:hypothetical protein